MAVRHFKAVRELGSERRETVRSLSAVGVGILKGSVPSTRGPGMDGSLVDLLWRQPHSRVAISGRDNR